MHYADVVVRGEPIIQRLLQEKRLPNSALIVPGGGFQGTRSGGMLCVFDALGLDRAFEAAYGVSSGAANIAYFLARQTLIGVSVYYTDLVDGRYANAFRQPIVDIDYLVYEIMAKRKRLPVELIKGSPTNFHVVGVDSRGESSFFRVGGKIDVLDALRLAMSFPFYTAGAFEWDGSKYYDGAMVEPIPFRRAVADGYRNILVLLNMPFAWEDAEDGFLLRAMKRSWVRTEDEALRARYFQRQVRYQEQLRDLLEGDIGDANITVIAPSISCSQVDFYTRRASLLRRSAEEGVQVAEEAFDVRLSLRLP